MRGRRKSIWVTAFVLLMTALAAAGPGGPGWRGSRGWSGDGPYGRLFDARTMTAVSGTIVAVDRFTPMRGMSAGIHIRVKSGNQTYDVHVGPEWYLESQDARLKVGDQVEVRGSRVQIDKKPAIIAASIKRGEDVLELRDDDGFPRWAGWRRRGLPPG